MNEIEDLKQRVKQHNMMCDRYAAIWDKCTSRKQLFDMAASVQGSDTLCKAISEGWGLDVDYICNKFRHFINDNYISEQEDYDSKMYVKFYDNMVANTTLVLVICCNGSIEIPDNIICEVRLVDSNVTFTGTGICNVKKYGKCTTIYKDKVIHHEL